MTDRSGTDPARDVVVAVVESRFEADLAVGLLGSGGIGAVLSADDAGGEEPSLQLQGVRVLVAPSDAAAARQVLAAVETPPGTDADTGGSG